MKSEAKRWVKGVWESWRIEKEEIWVWKSTGEWSYFLGNVLVKVRVVFLPDCPLILSLLKHRDVGAF